MNEKSSKKQARGSFTDEKIINKFSSVAFVQRFSFIILHDVTKDKRLTNPSKDSKKLKMIRQRFMYYQH